MAEGARLESVYSRKAIEGSNPSLSAILFFSVVVCENGMAGTNRPASWLRLLESERSLVYVQ